VITMYLYFSVGMYITTVLSHSNSYLYWCLAYICEAISDLRIHVAVTSPYPRDRGVTEFKKTVILTFYIGKLSPSNLGGQ